MPVGPKTTQSQHLRETLKNMCSSGSSHAILHMATFKGFSFFHADFNLICCQDIEEAERSMELYSVGHRQRDGWTDEWPKMSSTIESTVRITVCHLALFIHARW